MRVLIATTLAAFLLTSFGADACFNKRSSGYAGPKMSRVAAKKPEATPAPTWGTKQIYGR